MPHKKTRLKRQWLVIFSILFTILSIQLINKVKTINLEYEKKATECNIAKGHSCSYYEIRQYIIHGE